MAAKAVDPALADQKFDTEDPTSIVYQGLASPEEVTKIQKIRELAAAELEFAPDFPELVGDTRILRFLRGYAGDPVTASDAYKKVFAWRAENNIDAIRQEIVDNNLNIDTFPLSATVLKFCCYNWNHKPDKIGNIGMLERAGTVNLKALVENVTLEDFVGFTTYFMEWASIEADRRTNEEGKLIKITHIKDLSGVGMQHTHKRGLEYIIAAIKVSQDNYPEMMGRVFLIDAPWVFSLIWKVVKPALNERTLQKVALLGGTYQKRILDAFDAENIPDLWGGTCTCPERSGCFPPLYGDGSNGSDAELVDVTVARSGKETAQVEVRAGGVCEWRMQSVGHDISFAVEFRVDGDDEPVELREAKRAPSNVFVDGNYIPTLDGTMVLTFDNSYSWVRSKKVRYSLNVTYLDEEANGEAPAPAAAAAAAGEAEAKTEA